MLNLRITLVCIIVVGAFLLPDVSNAKCICTKRINDYCCQTPDDDPSRKDACCNTNGFSVEPPQWQCDKNYNSECVEDMDCGKGGKCHECECQTGPGPEPEPSPGPEPEPTLGPDPEDCPEDSQCSPNKRCVEKRGEVCKCASCKCICEPKENGQCGDDAVCRTDQDCQSGSNNSTGKNTKCVDCTCMSTMYASDCAGVVDGCSKDSDCLVPEEDKDRCEGLCDTSICSCMIKCSLE